MAKPTNKSTDTSRVTRIRASDNADATVTDTNTDNAQHTAKKPVKTPATKKAAKVEQSAPKRRHTSWLKALGGYFKGSWQELRQVRWPDRKATWAMTGALIVFTLVFVVVIVLLDYGFEQLFKLIIGK